MNVRKPELYYSNFCKHSMKILEELNRSNMRDKINYINVDKRTMKDNHVYVLAPNGKYFPLPPMIDRVPVLLVKNAQNTIDAIRGASIIQYIKPQASNIHEERVMVSSEPNPYCFSSDNAGASGVVTDSFSYCDLSPNELKAQGNGGMSQMYNYAPVDYTDRIHPTAHALPSTRDSKAFPSMDEIQQRRRSDVGF
jgi:hypothetical protein